MAEIKPCTLYALWNGDHEVIYVGITSHQTNRFTRHAHIQEWWSEVAKASFLHFGTRAEALAMERNLIQALQPCYNVQHNGEGRSERQQLSAMARAEGAVEVALTGSPDALIAADRSRKQRGKLTTSGPYTRSALG